MKAKVIKTHRLILRPLTLFHLSNDYVNWMNDPIVNKYLETGGDYTLEKLEKFLLEQVKKDILFWAIHIEETNKHIGNIKIDPIDESNLTGEYGIMIGDKESWGKGFAKEASIAVLNYCFNQLNLSEIALGVVDENQGALQLYEKIGFKRIGDIPNKKMYDGKICRTIRMSMTK